MIDTQMLGLLSARLKKIGADEDKDLVAWLEAEIKNEDARWGQVAWVDDDIDDALDQREIESTPELIAKVRATWNCCHIDEAMLEAGWEAIGDAIAKVVEVQS